MSRVSKTTKKVFACMKPVSSSLKAIIFFLVYNIGVINLSLSLKDRFLKPNIKEIRRNLYGIENKRNFPIKKNKRDWRKSSWIRRKSS